MKAEEEKKRLGKFAWRKNEVKREGKDNGRGRQRQTLIEKTK